MSQSSDNNTNTDKFVNTSASKADIPNNYTASLIYQWSPYNEVDNVYNSQRYPIFGLNGAVCSSQSIATQIGISILQQGGNAADACISVAAALAVTEPCSTGLGGDCFAIYYNNTTHQVEGLNGSGRSPAELHAKHIHNNDPERQHAIVDKNTNQITAVNPHSIHAVTVPGAAAGWYDTYEKWSNKVLTFLQLLQPAINLCYHGFVVGVTTSGVWHSGAESIIKNSAKNAYELLIYDNEIKQYRAPLPAEIMYNKYLGHTLEIFGKYGKEGFYKGEIADRIIEAIQQHQGYMTHDDLINHYSTFPKPISITYHDEVEVHEIPPNGQGIAVLLALNVIKHLQPPIHKYKHNSVEHIHLLIESLRLAFADTRYYVSDMDHPANTKQIPITQLLSKEYAIERGQLINVNHANNDSIKHGVPIETSDTVSFVATDRWGNACSFINSNYMGFGSGIIPRDCGFSLQNRGAGFVIDDEEKHLNHLHGNKRPYHTIIPGMATRQGKLYAPFSVMGAYMQPQGHVQVLCHMIDYHLSPQAAIDQPRFCIDGGKSDGTILLEPGFHTDVIDGLKKRGHKVRIITGLDRAIVGRAQIIRQLENKVYAAASDARADGQAAAY